jgi:single-strand DNA-binding protein
MANLNKVLIIGNLTRDPEIKYTPKGTAVADIGLAVNRNWTDDSGEKKEETTFVDVTLWGRQAEVAEQYLKKGRPVFIEGRLQLDTWDDRQTGQKRSRLRVVAENLQLLGNRSDSGSSPAGTQPPQARPTAPAPRQPAPRRDFDAEPDDIPFRSTICRDVRRSRLNRRVF